MCHQSVLQQNFVGRRTLSLRQLPRADTRTIRFGPPTLVCCVLLLRSKSKAAVHTRSRGGGGGYIFRESSPKCRFFEAIITVISCYFLLDENKYEKKE